MKAISIKQPFASMIANGQKTHECRTWQVSYRGPLAIVASKAPHVDGLPCGALVCVVDLVSIDGIAGRYAWKLANPRAVEARKVRGFAALYTVPDGEIAYTGKRPLSTIGKTSRASRADDDDDDGGAMDPMVARLLARKEYGE